MEKLASSRVQPADKLRLAMLYALRYEELANVRLLKAKLIEGGVSPDKAELLEALLRYAGKSQR
jgi:vacuolar protein sorting-associated protein 45